MAAYTFIFNTEAPTVFTPKKVKMKKMMIVLMALLCHFQSQSQDTELTNYIDFNGLKLTIGDKQVFKTENGQNYALIDEKFHLITFKELNISGPLQYFPYITREDGSLQSVYEIFGKPSSKENASSGTVRRVKKPLFPDSKPFSRYTSPRSGKRFRLYSVKRTPDGRIIPEEEFQSYQGNFKYIRKIEGGDYAMDTTIIAPPTEAELKSVADAKKRFKAQIGTKMPSFIATDLLGNKINSVDLLGKTIVINFWFIGCPPCVKEIPDLNKLVDQYKDRDDIVFLGLATDTPPRLKKFLDRLQFDYQIFSESLPIAEDFLVAAYPTNFVIDKQGIIQYAHTGLNDHTLDEIANSIKKALE